MSFQAMAWAVKHEAHNTAERILLLMIANYADAEGVSYPSQARLSADTLLCERKVRATLADLEEQGVLRREPRTLANGGRTSDRLILAMDTPRHVMPVGGTPPRHGIGEAPAQEDPTPPAPGAGNPVSLEPVSEPESPLTPLKPKELAEQERVTTAIWRGALERSRQRSNGELALRAAVAVQLEAGVAGDDLIAAFAAYAESPDATKDGGEFAKGLHRLFEHDLWRNFLPLPKTDEEAIADQVAETHDRVRWAQRVGSWWNGEDWEYQWGPQPDQRGFSGPPDLACERAAGVEIAWGRRERQFDDEGFWVRPTPTVEEQLRKALAQRARDWLGKTSRDPGGYVAALIPPLAAWEREWRRVGQRPAWFAPVAEAV